MFRLSYRIFVHRHSSMLLVRLLSGVSELNLCLSVCLPGWLGCRAVGLSGCLSVGRSVCLSVWLSVCLSVCLSCSLPPLPPSLPHLVSNVHFDISLNLIFHVQCSRDLLLFLEHPNYGADLPVSAMGIGPRMKSKRDTAAPCWTSGRGFCSIPFFGQVDPAKEARVQEEPLGSEAE